VISESPKFQVQDLVANFGGTLGLCLGASLLTLAELFELLIEVTAIFLLNFKTKKVNEINRIDIKAEDQQKDEHSFVRLEIKRLNHQIQLLQQNNRDLNVLLKSFTLKQTRSDSI
jgi:hypothetical protein